MTQRFNKGYDGTLMFPVTDVAALAPSSLASPRVGDAHGLPSPTMPEDEGFQAELQEVADVRIHVLANRWPSHFLESHNADPSFDPDRLPMPIGKAIKDPCGKLPWGEYRYTAAEAANIVHMDKPTDLLWAVFDWLRATQDFALKADTPHKDFLENIPAVFAALAQRANENLEKAFEAKYYFGRPRPEEVFNRCPNDLGIFTHYPEGCPTHPAYPAGHGAAAAAVSVLLEVFDMSDKTVQVIKDSAYHWAMYRTFAGVHYANDNLAGLIVGGLGSFTDSTAQVWSA